MFDPPFNIRAVSRSECSSRRTCFNCTVECSFIYGINVCICDSELAESVANDSLDLLSDLKKEGRKIMMTTSKPLQMAITVAKNNEIFDLFDGIIGPGLDEKDSDKAVLIRRAMESLSLKEDDRKGIVMVGDRFYDIEGAKKVGIDSIGVLYGYGNKEELSKAGATHLAEDVSALRKLLLD